MTDTTPDIDPLDLAVFAQVRQANAVVLRNDTELVEAADGSVSEVSVPVYAQPGEVIDVSHWVGIGAYVDRGQIMLLGPSETDAHKARLREARGQERAVADGQSDDQSTKQRPQQSRRK